MQAPLAHVMQHSPICHTYRSCIRSGCPYVPVMALPDWHRLAVVPGATRTNTQSKGMDCISVRKCCCGLHLRDAAMAAGISGLGPEGRIHHAAICGLKSFGLQNAGARPGPSCDEQEYPHKCTDCYPGFHAVVVAARDGAEAGGMKNCCKSHVPLDSSRGKQGAR